MRQAVRTSSGERPTSRVNFAENADRDIAASAASDSTVQRCSGAFQAVAMARQMSGSARPA